MLLKKDGNKNILLFQRFLNDDAITMAKFHQIILTPEPTTLCDCKSKVFLPIYLTMELDIIHLEKYAHCSRNFMSCLIIARDDTKTWNLLT